MLGSRRVARNTDERTVIAAVIPWGAASYGWIVSAGPSAEGLAILCAQYNSFVFDFLARQFLTQPSIPQSTFEQLPSVAIDQLRTGVAAFPRVDEFIVKRSVALCATGRELVDWSQECGQAELTDWDALRRESVRAELDALFFHLFGVARGDVDYIMDTFSIVKRKDIAEYDEYRTKRLILETYDAIAEAEANGVPYASPFDKVHKQ